MEKGNRKQEENAKKVYTKLHLLEHRKLPVHFRLITGNFYNGNILDLNEEKLTLVLKEFKLGEMPFLLEEIDHHSIKAFMPKWGEKQ